MTYVGDFFKRLFRKSNIPMIIYLVINLALVFVGTSVLIAMLTSDNPLDDAAFIVVSILASILLYGVGIIVALSPLGEYILRTKLGCKEIKEQDILNRIVPIFNEVHAVARRVNPSIAEDIKLFMNDDEDVNAFATGRKTVCFNRGLLQLTDAEIKGVFAHEFGHIANHDTDFTLVVNVANWIVSAYFMIAWVVIMIYKYVIKGVSWIIAFASDSIGGAIASLLGGVVVDAMITISIKLLSSLWTFIGNMLVKASSRGNEYLADKFAKDSGFGQGLLAFFNRYASANQKLSLKEKIASLSDTHPPMTKRIDALLK